MITIEILRMQHATQKKGNMTIKEYLESIGRISPGGSIITSQMAITQEIKPFREESLDEFEYPEQTVGEVFDLLKDRYKSMPANIQVNAQRWQGQPFEGRYEAINKLD